MFKTYNYNKLQASQVLYQYLNFLKYPLSIVKFQNKNIYFLHLLHLSQPIYFIA